MTSVVSSFLGHELTELQAYLSRVSMGHGYPHHYYPCSAIAEFRFSGYDFTWLLTMTCSDMPLPAGVSTRTPLRLWFASSVLTLCGRGISPLISMSQLSCHFDMLAFFLPYRGRIIAQTQRANICSSGLFPNLFSLVSCPVECTIS